MSAPYLNEIRLDRPVRDEIREIEQSISNEFGLRDSFDDRFVPHITLFGPYNTHQGYEVKRRTQAVLSGFQVVPFKIDGFGYFRNDTIFLDVTPSETMRALRRGLFTALRPTCFNYQSYDGDRYYDFHITLASNGIQEQFEEIWEFVNTNFSYERECYAKRVNALRKQSMMWEWDLPRASELNPDEAKYPWQETNAALLELQSPSDHQNLSPKPSGLKPLFDSLLWKVKHAV